MHASSVSAYGLWSLVVVNSLIFIFFAFSFMQPTSQRDWRSFLVVMYRRLALCEERETAAQFGETYRRYAAGVPRFIPRLWKHGDVTRNAVYLAKTCCGRKGWDKLYRR